MQVRLQALARSGSFDLKQHTQTRLAFHFKELLSSSYTLKLNEGFLVLEVEVSNEHD